MTDWPFDQPPDCATISLNSIVFESGPILYVSHDAEDHGWQFLDGENVAMSNAAVVALSEIVDLDPSVLTVADLPPGLCAWRESVNSPWLRKQRV